MQVHLAKDLHRIQYMFCFVLCCKIGSPSPKTKYKTIFQFYHLYGDRDGENEKEIYDYLIGKYGEWILYDPKFSKNTYILWLLPVIIFLIGGFVIFRLFIIKKN